MQKRNGPSKGRLIAGKTGGFLFCLRRTDNAESRSLLRQLRALRLELRSEGLVFDVAGCWLEKGERLRMGRTQF